MRALLPPDPPHVLRRAQDPRWLDGQLVKIMQDVEALQALERRRDVHWTYQYSQACSNRGAESLIPVDDGDEGNDPVKGPCDPDQSPDLLSPDVTRRVGALRACMEALTYQLGTHPNLWRRVDDDDTSTCMLYTWSESQEKLDGLRDQSHGPNYKWAAITEFQGRRELRAAVDLAQCGRQQPAPDRWALDCQAWNKMKRQG